MVCDAEMAFHHEQQQCHDPIAQDLLPWWNLRRPAKPRQTSLLGDLGNKCSPMAAAVAPTSSDRLFDDASKERRRVSAASPSASLVGPWTCSKADESSVSCSAASVSVQDTEAPSPDSRYGGGCGGLRRGFSSGGESRRGLENDRNDEEDGDEEEFASSSLSFASNSVLLADTSSSTSASLGLSSSAKSTITVSQKLQPTVRSSPFPVLLLPASGGQKRPRAPSGGSSSRGVPGVAPAVADDDAVATDPGAQDPDPHGGTGTYPAPPGSLVSYVSGVCMDGLEDEDVWEATTSGSGMSPLPVATATSMKDIAISSGGASRRRALCFSGKQNTTADVACSPAAILSAAGATAAVASTAFSAEGKNGIEGCTVGTGGGPRKMKGGARWSLPCDAHQSKDENNVDYDADYGDEMKFTPAFGNRSTGDNDNIDDSGNSVAATPAADIGGGRKCRGRVQNDEDHVGDDGVQPPPCVVYDVLAVDRGCGNCDTSVVPFPMEAREEVPLDKMRAVAAGQGEFLARRGFAAGLVAHFLEETDAEFRALQGGTCRGMSKDQIEEAALRLEEVFIPAVRGLKTRASMDVVLDSLFQGQDDAGDFVVRFEVTITRCHPEDMESSSARALRDCAPAIRNAVRLEGVAAEDTHEVVFVGRPLWELVPPVWDFSSKK